jgi:hypothetical protein
VSDSFYTYHHENHSEIDFPQWVHSMNLMANRFLDEVSLTEQPSISVMNMDDQEEVDPPRDTSMLIWDPNLIMPFDDIFESREQPMEFSVIQMHSKGPPDSKDIDATRASQSKLNLDHPKLSFALGKKPISIHTQESPTLDYNLVEDLKNLKANISVMDICRIL